MKKRRILKKTLAFILVFSMIMSVITACKQKTFTVSFNSNGGTEVAAITKVIDGAKITEPQQPTKDDFVFDGWYKDSDLTQEWDFETDTVKSNITLFAKWSAEVKFTVTFDSTGGSPVTAINNIKSGTKIQAPAAPTKDDYTFDGWYKESALNNKWDFNTDTVTSNITLFAKWSLVPISYDLDYFKDSYGFASLRITDRSAVEQAKIASVANEVEFLEALKNSEISVIKITADLDLGYNNVVAKLTAAEKDPAQYTDGSVYRQNPNIPKVHPTLISSGVGQMILKDRNGLMIYSENGATIRHLTTRIESSEDIVIRNLKLTDIWEWDDQDLGQYDTNDWDYFTLEKDVKGIWFDHLTLSNAYDGIIDIKKGCSDITISWINMDFSVTDFIRDQFKHLQDNADSFPYYKSVKQANANLSDEELMTFFASAKKGFNIGNTTDGTGFEDITVTIHNIYAKNLQDRLPRIRKGDVHLYNVYSDSSELYQVSAKSNGNLKITSQAIVSTEDGAVLMENSVLKGIQFPVKTHQESNPDVRYTGKFKVNNSRYTFGDTDVLSSSDDVETSWVSFNAQTAQTLDFYFRNYQVLPYNYELADADDVLAVFKGNPVGAGAIEGLNWLEIDTDLSIGEIQQGYKINRNISVSKVFVPLDGTFAPESLTFRNFYKKLNTVDYDVLIEDTDYTLSIDNPVNTAVLGEYTVTYTVTSLHDEDDILVLRQQVVVYGSDVYDFASGSVSVSNEFDGNIILNFTTLQQDGKAYYLLSDEAIVDKDTIIAQGVGWDISVRVNTISKIATNDKHYVHMLATDGTYKGDVISLPITLETEVNISNADEFVAMVTSGTNSQGKYYILTADIDLTDKTWSSKDFYGVLDGAGHTVSNASVVSGIFADLNKAAIKKITFDNITAEGIDDGCAIISKKISGLAVIHNIAIKNSSVNTAKSYGAILTGRSSGEIIIDGLAIINSSVVNTANKYNAGLIGELQANGKAIAKDIYINGLAVSGSTDMTSVLICRMDGTATFERIVIYSTSLQAGKNIGTFAGKFETNATQLSIKDVFAEVEITCSNTAYGYVTGNINGKGDIVAINNYIALELAQSTAIDATTIMTQLEIDAVDNAWWTANLASVFQSDLWTISEGKAALK